MVYHTGRRLDWAGTHQVTARSPGREQDLSNCMSKACDHTRRPGLSSDFSPPFPGASKCFPLIHSPDSSRHAQPRVRPVVWPRSTYAGAKPKNKGGSMVHKLKCTHRSEVKMTGHLVPIISFD